MSAGSVPAKIEAVISVDDGVSAAGSARITARLCSNANESRARRDALLADAAHDRGRLLRIEAPPGMGKSALVEHIAETRSRTRVCVVPSAAGREPERGLGWGVAWSLFELAVARCSAQERDELLSGSAAAAGPPLRR